MKAPAIAALAASILFSASVSAQTPQPRPFELSPEARAAQLARAKALDNGGSYVPPPGERLSQVAAGWAKTVCSAVFVTGLDETRAIDEVGHPVAPAADRAQLGRPVIDRAARAVRVAVPGGPERLARQVGSQGCVALPPGETQPAFKPLVVEPRTSADAPWPLGDRLVVGPPSGVAADKLAAAVDAAFAPEEALTSAFVVVWKGQIIAERYGPGYSATTPLESWSMGKSIIAAMMGVLIEQGVYDLDQPAPIPEWRAPGDPRQAIRIRDLLNMSSGLRSRSPSDPDYDPAGPYPDHQHLYTGTDDAFRWAATRPVQWPAGQVGRYRNTDPVLVSYLIRLAAEKRGEPYLAFPQRALFDRIGIRTAVLETDPHGNFLTQGYELMSARDWARLALLFLNDGVFAGQRVLPKAYVDFVRTPAPGWAADGQPVYGGFFVLNTNGLYPVPRDAYFMAGAGGQTTLIVPSLDLIVVRIGHAKGQAAAGPSFRRALTLVSEAISG